MTEAEVLAVLRPLYDRTLTGKVTVSDFDGGSWHATWGRETQGGLTLSHIGGRASTPAPAVPEAEEEDDG